MKPFYLALLCSAISASAFAQSAAPTKPVDQSIAANTQQAAGQLSEINKKLEIITRQLERISARRAPLVLPATIDCKSGACHENAKKMCLRYGYAHGEVIGGQAPDVSSWLCFNDP